MLGVNRTWPENFQMYKLGFKEAKEPEIKSPTFTGSWRKQRNTKKNLLLLHYAKPLIVWITTSCGKFLKRWESDYLTCLLQNLYACQEATVRTGHGTMDWFQLGKGVGQGCILLPCLFNLYADYIMWNAGLNDSQAGIKTARRNINNLR